MKRLLILTVILLSGGIAYGQTENPRGIYRMKSMISNQGIEINAPFDQYKVCTDSISLAVSIQGNRFSINNNDGLLNYTGEAPDATDPHRIRIYDSNAGKFTLKWWSNYSNHFYFPKNDWCTEYYVSNSYSPVGKKVFDRLTSQMPQYDRKQPLYGAWRMLDVVDELKDVKRFIKEVQNQPEKNRRAYIQIFAPGQIFSTSGVIADIESDGKTYYRAGNQDKIAVHIVSSEYIAIEVKRGRVTDYAVWQRVTDPRTPLEIIASEMRQMR